jgi:hypothetical protein
MGGTEKGDIMEILEKQISDMFEIEQFIVNQVLRMAKHFKDEESGERPFKQINDYTKVVKVKVEDRRYVQEHTIKNDILDLYPELMNAIDFIYMEMKKRKADLPCCHKTKMNYHLDRFWELGHQNLLDRAMGEINSVLKRQMFKVETSDINLRQLVMPFQAWIVTWISGYSPKEDTLYIADFHIGENPDHYSQISKFLESL